MQLNADDYRRYFAILGNRQSKRLTSAVLVAALFAAIAVAFVFRALASFETSDQVAIELAGRYSLFAYALGVLVFLVLVAILRRRSIGSMLAGTPHAFDPRTIVLNDEGVSFRGKLSDVRYTWPAFTQLTVTRGMICLWMGPQSAGIIPERAFATNEVRKAAIAFMEGKIVAAKQSS